MRAWKNRPVTIRTYADDGGDIPPLLPLAILTPFAVSSYRLSARKK
jgi:hypothetical protein